MRRPGGRAPLDRSTSVARYRFDTATAICICCPRRSVLQRPIIVVGEAVTEPIVRRLPAGGNRIRTIGPALVKGLSAVADERCRTDKLDGVIKHRSSRETTMVGRGASLDDRLFLGGTDGSNPAPSSGESVSQRELACRGREARLFARVCGPWQVAHWAETGIGRRHGTTGD